MEAKELISFQMEESAKQVDKVLADLNGDLWIARLSETSMSPSQIVDHLTECYVAVQKSVIGKEHEWGSYVSPTTVQSEQLETMRKERAKAREAILASNEDQSYKDASGYFILHDAYHVGQLVALRIEKDKDWNPYSIYG